MKVLMPTDESIRQRDTFLENRIIHLEETLLEVYRSFSHTFGEIDFTQMPPESFKSPYSIHSFPVPNTTLSVTLITTPPLLTLGTPQSNTPGPLRWQHMLEIQLPSKIKFISFRYGGGTGTLEWSSDSGPGHVLPTLPALVGAIQTRVFQLVRSEGIRSVKLTSSGEMVLYKLAIGI